VTVVPFYPCLSADLMGRMFLCGTHATLLILISIMLRQAARAAPNGLGGCESPTTPAARPPPVAFLPAPPPPTSKDFGAEQPAEKVLGFAPVGTR